MTDGPLLTMRNLRVTYPGDDGDFPGQGPGEVEKEKIKQRHFRRGRESRIPLWGRTGLIRIRTRRRRFRVPRQSLRQAWRQFLWRVQLTR